jgi:hypothetical protein
VRFVEVLVRQAHPGERHGAYHSYEEKLAQGRAYRREEQLPWPVLVDDLAGRVQRAYGGLAAAAYLIDTRGRVAFCGTWGRSPALRAAIDELLERGGAGVPAGRGSDRRPHLGSAIVAGQGGPCAAVAVRCSTWSSASGRAAVDDGGQGRSASAGPGGATLHPAAAPGPRRAPGRRPWCRHRDRIGAAALAPRGQPKRERAIV